MVSMATVESVLRWLKRFFLQKPLTKDTAQMALFLVFNESANTKKALCTYLKLIINGNFVGLVFMTIFGQNSFL